MRPGDKLSGNLTKRASGRPPSAGSDTTVPSPVLITWMKCNLHSHYASTTTRTLRLTNNIGFRSWHWLAQFQRASSIFEAFNPEYGRIPAELTISSQHR